MTKTTRVTYETCPIEEECWECDHCGSLVDEDEINTVVYAEGDQAENTGQTRHEHTLTDATSEHMCEDCLGLRHAHSIEVENEYYRNWWRGTRKHLAWVTLTIVPFLLGISTQLFMPVTNAESLLGAYFGAMTVAVTTALIGGASFGFILLLIEENT